MTAERIRWAAAISVCACAGLGAGVGVAQECPLNWGPIGGGVGGTYPWVHALTVYNGELVAGGCFTTAGGVTANGIARWNGTSWQPLGTGMGDSNPYVSSLTVYNGELIAAGGFATAGGVTANNIARWDGASWQALGTGINSSVYALTIYNGELIAGGGFWNAGGATCNQVARWNGTSWQPLGNGIDYLNILHDLAVYDGELYVSAEPESGYVFFHWDGMEWHLTGCGNAHPNVLCVYNGELSAGGWFWFDESDGIGRWNGWGWEPLGSGVKSDPEEPVDVRALMVHNGELFAGGNFAQAGGQAADHVAAWDGAQWRPLGGSGLDAGVGALLVYNDELVVGGAFTHAGGQPCFGIARMTFAGPAISVQPASQIVYGDETFSFSAGAAGTGSLGYQWRRNGVPLVNGERVFGAATDTLTISPVWLSDVGDYDVLVTDDCGSTISESSTLTVLVRYGDLNCDGHVNFGDINPFVLALTSWGTYQQQYPDCDIYLADINDDGYVSFGDINPFVALLSGS